ncbi:hypothetical protein ACFSFY_10955 [Sporosarcina siberiensis]|uniref:YfhD-like protein n=1 Tax=Sporosarcina siberiensis TaxID=1365606 RepID=A0ABW4SGB9_9BACL
MANKNNKKTMNERTHNPFEAYTGRDKADNNNSNDKQKEEFAAEFDSKVKRENNTKRKR